MPQLGERKTVGSTTGEWNGSTWIEVPGGAGAQTAAVGTPHEPQRSALSRFLGGAIGNSPLGGIYSALTTNPLETAGQLVKTGFVDPITEGVETGRSLYQAATNTADPKTGGGRGSALIDAVRHAEGAIPFFGKSLQGSSDKIAAGDDLAGGVGEVLGTASNVLAPKGMKAVKAGIPSSMRGLRAVAGKVGSGLETAGEHMRDPYVRGPVIAGTLMHGNLPAAMAATVGPEIMGAAGRGLGRFAAAEPSIPGEPTAPPAWMKMGSRPRVSSEVPGSSYPAEGYSAPERPIAAAALAESPKSAYNPAVPNEMQAIDAMPERPVHPAMQALLDRAEQADQPDLMADFEASQAPKQAYSWPEAGGDFVKDAEGSDVLAQDYPDFTYEGEANLRPGEFAPGPTIDIKGFGDRVRAVDMSGESVDPLNYTKSGYLEDPNVRRVHRRGWNEQQVEAARQRALDAIRNLDSYQGVR